MNAKEQLDAWRTAQLEYSTAREDYRRRWAEAFASHETVKPETARKAKADVETSDLRRRRDELEIAATAAWQAFLVLRGTTDYSRQPGHSFD